MYFYSYSGTKIQVFHCFYGNLVPVVREDSPRIRRTCVTSRPHGDATCEDRAHPEALPAHRPRCRLSHLRGGPGEAPAEYVAEQEGPADPASWQVHAAIAAVPRPLPARDGTNPRAQHPQPQTPPANQVQRTLQTNICAIRC